MKKFAGLTDEKGERVEAIGMSPTAKKVQALARSLAVDVVMGMEAAAEKVECHPQFLRNLTCTPALQEYVVRVGKRKFICNPLTKKRYEKENS